MNDYEKNFHKWYKSYKIVTEDIWMTSFHILKCIFENFLKDLLFW